MNGSEPKPHYPVHQLASDLRELEAWIEWYRLPRPVKLSGKRAKGELGYVKRRVPGLRRLKEGRL